MEKYTCTQAQITANEGETMKANIMECGEKYAEQLRLMRDQLWEDYWIQSKALTEQLIESRNQTAAIAKLGALALALEAVEKAFSAANRVRCF